MNYFEEARKIGKELNDFLFDLYKDDDFFLKIIHVYTNKEIHLNACQFFGGFVAGRGDTQEEYKKYHIVPILLELTMLWAYHTNQIIDEKKEIWKDKESVKNCVVDHDMISILIFDLLEKSKPILKENYLKLDFIVKYLMTYLLKGFDIEKYKLNIFENDLPSILKDWKQNYKKRNQYFNFVYDYSSLVGFWLASGDYAIFDRYQKHIGGGDTFGSFGQIINDMGDFSISPDAKVKVYQDKFADLKNGIITYPVHALKEDSDILDALKDRGLTFDIEWQKRVSKKAISLLPEIKKEGKNLFKSISAFWKENSLNQNTQFLMNTYLILKMSKYLHKDKYLSVKD